jgi:hypothetical protein
MGMKEKFLSDESVPQWYDFMKAYQEGVDESEKEASLSIQPRIETLPASKVDKPNKQSSVKSIQPQT